MDHEGLLQPETCFVEFGAGRGKLLHFVKQALGEHVPADYLAIDRESTRLKFDRFHTVRALEFIYRCLCPPTLTSNVERQ
jgi:tRNA:m4X modification enzyme